MMNKLKVKSKKLKSQAGFTVLESIVAILILSLSISGVFASVQQSLSQSIIAKDEVKAFYLAQEAVEIIKNRIDSNQVNKVKNGSGSAYWLQGISQFPADPCFFGKVCETESRTVPPSLIYCNSSTWGNCRFLKQLSDFGVYTYTYIAGNTTTFKREIKLQQLSPEEISVTVRVSWKKGMLPERSFMIKTLMFDWI